MTMTIENPYEDYIKIIDVILRKIEADPGAGVYTLKLEDFPHSYSIEQKQEQINFLSNLVKKRAIERIERYGLPRGATTAYFIHEPNRKLLLKERKRLVDFDKPSNKDGTEASEKIILFFTPDGDLYREPKNKYCYSLSKEKMREKIIRFLNGKGYQSTEIIQAEVGSADAQSIRLAIGKINDKAKSLLGLKSKLIEGRKGSGYRINPQYKIVIQ